VNERLCAHVGVVDALNSSDSRPEANRSVVRSFKLEFPRKSLPSGGSMNRATPGTGLRSISHSLLGNEERMP